VKRSVEAYVGCVAGASMKDDYLEQIRRAGFASVEVLEQKSYAVGSDLLPDAGAGRAMDAVLSIKVRAVKPLR
jgi:hypothetical protein